MEVKVNGKAVEVTLELRNNGIWTITWWWSGEAFSKAFSYKPAEQEITSLVVDYSLEYSLYDSTDAFAIVYTLELYEWAETAGRHFGLDCLVLQDGCTTIHFKENSDVQAAYEDLTDKMSHREVVYDGETIKLYEIA